MQTVKACIEHMEAAGEPQGLPASVRKALGDLQSSSEEALEEMSSTLNNP